MTIQGLVTPQDVAKIVGVNNVMFRKDRATDSESERISVST